MDNHLDQLYDAYWNSPESNPSPDALITGVRQEAMKLTHDDDIAQDACIVVLNKLSTFVRNDATAFNRWVSTIIKRTRLNAKKPGVQTVEYNEASGYEAQDEHVYVDTSSLPKSIKQIADSLLAGYSLLETALRLGVKPATLRKQLERHRKCHVSTSPIHI
jgi:DNA-directed RNA polymerase specialized sigma24 family protein